MPPSLRYVQRLLRLQAGIWALAAIAGAIFAAEALAGGLNARDWVIFLVALLCSAFAIGTGALKIQLAGRLGRGRSPGARKAVIAVELAMTGLGVLWFLSPYSGPVVVLAGLAGAGLSLAAVLVLTRSQARTYAEADDVDPGSTNRDRGRALFLEQRVA